MTKRTNLQQILLEILREQRSITDDELIVHAIQRLRNVDPHVDDRKVKPRYVIKRTVKRMADRGMITRHTSHQHTTITLSPEGKKRLRILLNFKRYLPSIPPVWDGKWRIIILDISEEQKSVRDRVRKILEESGFSQLKNSIWIHSCDCQDFVTALRDTFDLRDQIIYVVADSIDTVS